MVAGLCILSSYIIEPDGFFSNPDLTSNFQKPGKLCERLWKDISQLTVCFISSVCFEFAIFQLPLIFPGSCIREHNEHKVCIYVPYTLVVS